MDRKDEMSNKEAFKVIIIMIITFTIPIGLGAILGEKIFGISYFLGGCIGLISFIVLILLMGWNKPHSLN